MNRPRKTRSVPAAPRDAALALYRPDLHRFLTQRLRNAETAGDLAQDAFLRFLQLPRGDLIRKPQAYLYRIAANLVYEYKLKERRESITYDSDAVEELAEHTAEAVRPIEDSLATRQQLERVLKQIPPLYRAVLILQKRDGLSYAEIGERLGLSVHTVQKYLFRALAHCRAADWDR